jgi:hypothetical protein
LSAAAAVKNQSVFVTRLNVLFGTLDLGNFLKLPFEKTAKATLFFSIKIILNQIKNFALAKRSAHMIFEKLFYLFPILGLFRVLSSNLNKSIRVNALVLNTPKEKNFNRRIVDLVQRNFMKLG